jgi:immunity protein 5 of polymorphic toxin system
MGKLVILPKIRDPRFITVRRGGTLQDDDHRLLAMWAADCAEHVLDHFEQARPKDDRPRRAIDLGRAWARGEITWRVARTAAGHANAAARDLSGAARHAAYAAGQAAAVGHVAAHELGAAAYAIRAARAAAAEGERETADRLECQWQRAQLPREIRVLVLDDQRLRNELCWFVFNCGPGSSAAVATPSGRLDSQPAADVGDARDLQPRLRAERGLPRNYG